MTEQMQPEFVGYFDGACNNTGNRRMGIGAILYQHNRIIGTVSEHRGVGTSNEAEWLALIALLELAVRKGVKELHIRGDSELVVFQMRGKYRVKAENLKPFKEKAYELCRKIGMAKIRHIPREQNKEADKLSHDCLRAWR